MDIDSGFRELNGKTASGAFVTGPMELAQSSISDKRIHTIEWSPDIDDLASFKTVSRCLSRS